MMFGLHMFHEMEKIQREMDQLLCGFGMHSGNARLGDSDDLRVANVEGGYRVEAVLPGIDIEKLEIKVLGRRLHISAEPAEAENDEGMAWHRRERARGALNKSLVLSSEIDTEKVEAEYKNGILSIVLPKAASILPKKIDVKAG